MKEASLRVKRKCSGQRRGSPESAALDEERRFVSKGTLFEVASLLARGRERLVPSARCPLSPRPAARSRPPTAHRNGPARRARRRGGACQRPDRPLSGGTARPPQAAPRLE